MWLTCWPAFKNTSCRRRGAGLGWSAPGAVACLRHWLDDDEPAGTTQGSTSTVWEAAHHLIERLQNQGERGAGRLLVDLNPDLAAEARQLAYRLYSICERKSRADHALSYNSLVISWPAIQEEATRLRNERRRRSHGAGQFV
ncbi:MAG: hypothetical protein R2873_27430 [Caldilineaceae bacterium]